MPIMLGMALAGCANLSHEVFSFSDTASAAPIPSTKAKVAERTTSQPAQTKAIKSAKPQAQPLAAEAAQSATAPKPPVPADQPAIRPGECWVQAVIQPRPVQKPLEIVVRDAVNDIKITPATVTQDLKEIIVREGGVTYRIQPPVYKRVTEKVMVRPEIRRTLVVPAVFEERKEKIMIEDERTVLERCSFSTSRIARDTPVQPLCAKKLPAKYKTIERKVLVQPETTREVVEPAVYKEVSRWVLETPARAVPVEIAPKTAQIRVQEISSPEQIDEQQLPPKIKRLITTQYEGQLSLAFRRAVCDHELTPKLVQALQTALQRANFGIGRIDGKFGKRTQEAMLNYQRQNGLAYGALTYETLEHLGVKPEQ
ncbi:MAG: peptidoglycan-binding protein [Halothiobacillaceae bacterium]